MQGIGRVVAIGVGAFAFLIIVVALIYANEFGPMERTASTNQFLIHPDESIEDIAADLAKYGYVRSPFIFELAYLREGDGHPIRPGGYEISGAMDAWTLASQLTAPPYVAWVTIPVGLRKEQIGDRLAAALGWNPEERAQWDEATNEAGDNYIEGVYYPDTYLIPTDEAPGKIAERMRDNFKEHFAPYADEALRKHVPWPRVLTIASLIEREAGSVADMSIISGVIQNRLANHMPLAIDATLQYIKGNAEDGWWPRPGPAASYPNTPFNTYKNVGLPPHAIDNPGPAAIEAALNPTNTSCLFYIHDNHGTMHCSKTYSGQLANVNKYLK